MKFSCQQIGHLLAILRYDEERAVALAHLIMVGGRTALRDRNHDAASVVHRINHRPVNALEQRSTDGHESSELLKLCSVFDNDAKLESAFHHVRESVHFCPVVIVLCSTV